MTAGRDLDSDLISRLYDRKIRFSSAELPMGFLDNTGAPLTLTEPSLLHADVPRHHCCAMMFCDLSLFHLDAET